MDMVSDETVGQHLRAMRLAAGLQQQQMADRLGVHQVQVSRYERAENAAPLEIQRRWAQVCEHELVYRFCHKSELDAFAALNRDDRALVARLAVLLPSMGADTRAVLAQVIDASEVLLRAAAAGSLAAETAVAVLERLDDSEQEE